MKRRGIRHRVGQLLLVLSIGFFAYLLHAQHRAQPISVQLDPARMVADTGYGVLIQLAPPKFPLEIVGDTLGAKNTSKTTLTEDGKRIGPAHTVHTEIRRSGGGAFSHWYREIYFSSSDGTDPRLNGRTYVAQLHPRVSSVLWIVAGALFFMGIGFTLRHAISALYSLTDKASARTSKWLLIAVCIVGLGAGYQELLDGWEQTRTRSFAVAGVFPVSDAAGYYACAIRAGTAGSFSIPDERIPLSEWCSRRALYSLFLASLGSFTAWQPTALLVLQASLMVLGIVAIGMETARSFGRLAGIAAAAILGLYAVQFAVSRFVTEVLGLVAGSIGIALLLAGARLHRPWVFASGLAALSVGLFGRAGAMFALPLLLAWGVVAFVWRSKGGFIGTLVLLLSATSIGAVLQISSIALMGLPPTNTGGNFSASLYGLATGSRDWSEAYRVYPHLFAESGEASAFREIYVLAFDKIREHPSIFFHAIADALISYLTSLYDLFGTEAWISRYSAAMGALGVLVVLWRIRESSYQVLGALVIGELLIAPLIIDSGGQRVFAATAGTRAILFGLGVHLLFVTALRASGAIRPSSPGSPGKAPSPALSAVAAVGLILSIVYPVTPLSTALRPQPVAGLGCPSGQKEVVADIGAESLALQILSEPSPSSENPWTVSKDALASGFSGEWYEVDFRRLQVPVLLVRATQRLHDDFAQQIDLAWLGQIATQEAKGLYSFCLASGSSIEVAGSPFAIANSMQKVR